jgi:PIN domain nuclease of toxin-antitoxin system
MRVLLDTHALIWAVDDPAHLARRLASRLRTMRTRC